MKLYHATYQAYLSDIEENGLLPDQQKNWADCASGFVYLANDKDGAISFCETAEDVPGEVFDSGICCFEIDSDVLDPALLSVDPNILLEDNESPWCFVYAAQISPDALSLCWTEELGDIIKEPLQKVKWFDENALEKLEVSCPEKAKEIDYYLHGNCDEWVLENFQDGDTAVIWNEFDPGIGKICLIHCYIQRQDVFLDVRGETADKNLIEDGFDYGYIHDKIYCSSLEEYKSWIRNICGYEDKKWAKDSIQTKSAQCSVEQNHKRPSVDDQIQSASTRAIESHALSCFTQKECISMNNTLQSDYIFDEELCVEDEAHECIDGYLWATDSLVSKMKEQIRDQHTKDEISSLENINFYGVFNMANGSVELVSTYLYSKEVDGAFKETHGACQLPVSDREAEVLKEVLETYCTERYHMTPLGFVNEARSHEGLPALPRPSIPFEHIKPSLAEKIQAAMSRLPEKGATEEPQISAPVR